jgi:hypothetical protein
MDISLFIHNLWDSIIKYGYRTRSNNMNGLERWNLVKEIIPSMNIEWKELSKNIYNDSKEKITPAGEQEDAYQAWLKVAKDTFVSRKDQLFAGMKEKLLIFNLDEKSETVQRALRAKTIGGRGCETYKKPLLNEFSIWLVGEPLPANVATKEQRCIYLDLLVRQAVSAKKEGIFWITPEEFSVFSDDDNRPDLIRRLK